MSRTARVSVILPTHHRPRLLARALSSVTTQSHTNLEILVVQDEDADCSAHPVVEAFEDDRVQLLRARGTGPATKRNRALDEASGDVVAFLDDDDVWLPGKLQLQLRRLRDSGEGGVVYSRHARIRGRHVLPDPFPLYEGRVLEHLLSGWVPPITSNSLVRRDLLADIRYRPELDGLEDYDLWLQLAEITDFIAVDRVLTMVDQTGIGHMTQAASTRKLALGEFEKKWMPTANAYQVGPEFHATCAHLAWTNTVVALAREPWRGSLRDRLRVLVDGVQSPASRSSVPAVAVRLAVGERVYNDMILPAVQSVRGTPLSKYEPWVSLEAARA